MSPGTFTKKRNYGQTLDSALDGVEPTLDTPGDCGVLRVKRGLRVQGNPPQGSFRPGVELGLPCPVLEESLTVVFVDLHV
jgi:hypothetical protein